ncbi:MAG: DMT family transporter [Acetobacteraceae bacterium]|nr:DMT family transporter [Acetobacteraceae bacterium]
MSPEGPTAGVPQPQRPAAAPPPRTAPSPVPAAATAAAWRAPAQNTLLGILFICLSGLLFPMMNGAAKILGADYASLQVSWARAFGHVVFMLAAFLPRHGLALLRTRRPGLQIARSATLFCSNLCFFYAVTFIPIAKAAAISMTAPLIVALLAWPMLGERTTVFRVAALGVGFLGVLTVIRPGTAVFHWASLFVLASATCYGLYQILTRTIAAADPPETSTVYSSAVGAFAILLVLPFVWETPRSLFDAALFCSLGVLGALGHYCVAQALSLAPASVVSPFQYFQLLGSVAVGWVVFGDLPDALTWAGAAVIVLSGLFIGWSQTRPGARPG